MVAQIPRLLSMQLHTIYHPLKIKGFRRVSLLYPPLLLLLLWLLLLILLFLLSLFLSYMPLEPQLSRLDCSLVNDFLLYKLSMLIICNCWHCIKSLLDISHLIKFPMTSVSTDCSWACCCRCHFIIRLTIRRLTDIIVAVVTQW